MTYKADSKTLIPFSRLFTSFYCFESVWIQIKAAFYFFFFLRVNSNLTWIHCLRTVQYCSYTVHVLKILKMGPTILFTHLNIILLQCFQFSVFSFQFSATISSIQTHPMSGSTYGMKKNYKGMELEGLFIFNYFLN